jgi:hypothetical protein
MPKILFTSDAQLKQGDGKGPRFEAGKVYNLTSDACERWKRRKVAVDAPDDAPAANEPVRQARAAAPRAPAVVSAPQVAAKVDAAALADRAAKSLA